MIIYRHILKEHIAPFFYSIGVITFIFIMDLVIQLMDSILSKGLQPKVVLEVFALNLAWMVALSFPMAVLVSVLMAFGRLSADNEVTALKASGFNMYKMIVPSLMVSAIFCVGMIFFNNSILPESNHKTSVLMTDISRKKPAAFIQSGVIISDFQGYRILVEKLDPKTSDMENVIIYEENEKGGLPTTIFADRGKLEYVKDGDFLQFTLYDGETHQNDSEDPYKYFVAKFKKQIVSIKNTEHKLQRSKRSYRGDREMNVEMMQARIDGKVKEMEQTKKKIHGAIIEQDSVLFPLLNMNKPADEEMYNDCQPQIMLECHIRNALGKQRRAVREIERNLRIEHTQTKYISKYLVEIHKKYSIPVACLVFVLIGAPLGIKARAGGMGVGIAYSLAFFVIYWACLIGGETLSDKNLLPPWIAMWAPNLLVGAFGVYLLFSMVRETTFVSYRWLGRIGEKLGLKKPEPNEKGEPGQ